MHAQELFRECLFIQDMSHGSLMVTPSGYPLYPGTQGGVATLGSAVATWLCGHVTTRGSTMVRGGQIIDHEDPDTRHPPPVQRTRGSPQQE